MNTWLQEKRLSKRAASFILTYTLIDVVEFTMESTLKNNLPLFTQSGGVFNCGAQSRT